MKTISCSIAGVAALMACMFIGLPGRANNIAVTNVVGNDRVNGSHWMVQFDVAWANSWRSDLAGAGQSEPYNYDAAWVFIKYRVGGTSDWRHATLSTNTADHSAPTNATLKVGLDGRAGAWGTNGIGVFIHRNTNGSGTFAANNARLRWNYAADGVADGTQIELKACAIEMVYVSEGAFYAGNTNTVAYSYDAAGGSFREQSQSNSPAFITNELQRTIYWGTNNPGTGQPVGSAVLSNVFPKGYGAFYGMKHEITQAQYVDFLNMLTRAQQANRFVSTNVNDFMCDISSNIPSYRNGVQLISNSGGAPNPRVYACNLDTNNAPNSTNDGQWIVCNYLSRADIAAYLDWSGLRMMTELEYEKACRGPKGVVDGEFAWGTASVVGMASMTNMLNPGTASESFQPTNINYHVNSYSILNGPVRAGSFGIGSGSRIYAGAGYYGILGLTGNMWDPVVPIINNSNPSYTGEHGNGVLNSSGNADVTLWPTGWGSKGSAFVYSDNASVADRGWIWSGDYDRYYYNGGRGVRSAP